VYDHGEKKVISGFQIKESRFQLGAGDWF
jgi:hypothetical protein